MRDKHGEYYPRPNFKGQFSGRSTDPVHLNTYILLEQISRRHAWTAKVRPVWPGEQPAITLLLLSKPARPFDDLSPTVWTWTEKYGMHLTHSSAFDTARDPLPMELPHVRDALHKYHLAFGKAYPLDLFLWGDHPSLAAQRGKLET